jgi:hypothetical protein
MALCAERRIGWTQRLGAISHGLPRVWEWPSLLCLTLCTLQKEAAEVFFGVTKLFQKQDINLRRMMYLCIKDICPGADEVIIVTSSLMKDMNSEPGP